MPLSLFVYLGGSAASRGSTVPPFIKSHRTGLSLERLVSCLCASNLPLSASSAQYLTGLRLDLAFNNSALFGSWPEPAAEGFVRVFCPALCTLQLARTFCQPSSAAWWGSGRWRVGGSRWQWVLRSGGAVVLVEDVLLRVPALTPGRHAIRRAGWRSLDHWRNLTCGTPR